MNSLNIISARVSPPPSPGPTRTNSLSTIGLAVTPETDGPRENQTENALAEISEKDRLTAEPDEFRLDSPTSDDRAHDYAIGETTPLITQPEAKEPIPRGSAWVFYPKRIANAFVESIRWMLSTLAAPGVYLFACLCDVNGNFAPLLQLKKLFGFYGGNAKRMALDYHEQVAASEKHQQSIDGKASKGQRGSRESKVDQCTRERGPDPAKDISAQLKSPTSPVGALTKYPKTPAPPRPLIPRRQPSYINTADLAGVKHQKTLILDLDETLIHSMSKGGRMSSGHMVEVRLNTTYVGVGGQASIGPQHPILYYVHKRPHCDEFLRRVSKWYNLVVFTASVQEYADPVIDWLEADRKYFSARYYRQHCTFRHGAFIKDLSSVEPDLSKVMILDNSPLSYMFHQDNAIPIQGWISDPTDSDLMYLIPFLEGLQYVSDVRALLALRGGEDGQHMA
ncbi:Nuclear envelope morphology protein 1 [Madurella mycetomatis]|uniref:Nuclear envelope morphology protein 1 n=1 Tax=Madurella mycetomatis TaxID=100816 RepID=A0A175WGC0_9PEZI|nr:Nuclear envelope morphology protein 1 [Madurella mycetomatis]